MKPSRSSRSPPGRTFCTRLRARARVDAEGILALGVVGRAAACRAHAVGRVLELGRLVGRALLARALQRVGVDDGHLLGEAEAAEHLLEREAGSTPADPAVAGRLVDDVRRDHERVLRREPRPGTAAGR